jgi:hypothetical protein
VGTDHFLRGRSYSSSINVPNRALSAPARKIILKYLSLAIFLSASEVLTVLELEIKHKHGGFNINYEKATVVWQ